MIAAYRNITLSDTRDIVRRVIDYSPPETSSLKEFPDLDKTRDFLLLITTPCLSLK